MPEESDERADRCAVDREVVPEHGRMAADHRKQPGAEPQDAGLPGTVGTLEQHDLAALDAQIDPGQHRERSEDGHDAAQVDDGGDGAGNRFGNDVGSDLGIGVGGGLGDGVVVAKGAHVADVIGGVARGREDRPRTARPAAAGSTGTVAG